MVRMSITRQRVVAIVGGVFAVALVYWVATLAIQRRADVEERRSIYEQFAPFPGARETDAERYEIRGDDGGTGEYGLRVVYELPTEASAADVIDHYRSQIPDGWTAADDHLCELVVGALPPPPTMVDSTGLESPGDHGRHLMLTDSRLTVFTPDGVPRDGARVEGVTFALRRVGDAKYVVADEPDFACGAPGRDREAEDFDAPLTHS